MAATDFDLSENNGSALVTTSISLLVVTWISVILRGITRAILMKNIQIDDWFMLGGQIVFTVSCVFILLGVEAGLGRHNDAITDDESKVAALKWQALATATYILDMMLIKLSIGLFLLRFSVQRVYFWIIAISLAIITIWSTVLFFWNMFQCSPFEKQWDWRIQEGTCVTAEQVVQAAYAISVMTILSDWLYALLPIPMVWTVHMTTQAKITVMVILGLGIFASIATLVRIRYLVDLENTDDILFAGTDAMVWTLIEPGVAISAASLATIRPLLRKFKVPGFSTTQRTFYGSERSGAARSRSRSKPGQPAPGFSPNDITLVDVAHNTSSGKSYAGHHARPLTPDNTNVADPPKSIGLVPLTDSKSEVYVIEGQRRKPSSSWSDPNRSLDQIHDLEAQSQENDQMGLGVHDGKAGSPPGRSR